MEVGKEFREAIVAMAGYHEKPKRGDGRPFFIFSDEGDFLEGTLGTRRSNAEINRTCSYRLHNVTAMRRNGLDEIVPDDATEEIFANRYLQRVIEGCELVGSRVRITHTGRLKKKMWTHSAKIYRVEKVNTIITESKESCHAKTRRKRKSRGSDNGAGKRGPARRYNKRNGGNGERH